MEVRGIGELDSARANLPQNPPAAIRHYFQALNWYAPWGASQKAAAELRDLAFQYEITGQTELAYEANLRLRAGLTAARSFYLPRRDILDGANIFLANYLADRQMALDPSRDRAQLYSYYHSLYSRDINFSEFYGFIVVVSFIGWMYCLIMMLRSLFPNNDILPWKDRLLNSRLSAVLFGLCYLAWIFSMTAA
ncbi:MAG: hypothetical protein LBK52_07435 [Deltaproteobacteria bacterium]|nr:hypothetical protein [Deltaproteobacteria bacterium]